MGEGGLEARKEFRMNEENVAIEDKKRLVETELYKRAVSKKILNRMWVNQEDHEKRAEEIAAAMKSSMPEICNLEEESGRKFVGHMYHALNNFDHEYWDHEVGLLDDLIFTVVQHVVEGEMSRDGMKGWCIRKVEENWESGKISNHDTSITPTI